jgi:coenzyme F420-reducing hydrogenase delta subunit
MAPPSLIDFILSRGHADGVCIAGCAERGCQNRLGIDWTRQRLAGERDPGLRARVPRERIETIWAGPTEAARFGREIEAFRDRLAALPPETPRIRRAATAPECALEGAGP